MHLGLAIAMEVEHHIGPDGLPQQRVAQRVGGPFRPCVVKCLVQGVADQGDVRRRVRPEAVCDARRDTASARSG